MADATLTKEDLQVAAGWMVGNAEALANTLAPVYKLLDWRWGRLNKPPTAEEIEEALHDYAAIIRDEEPGYKKLYRGSGGLMVEVERDASATDGSYRICVRMGMEIDEQEWL